MDLSSPLMWAYRLLGGLALAPALAGPVAKDRFGGRWADRLGWTLCGGKRPLWFHGASVGEAQSALQIVSSLPSAGFSGPKVLSVGTPAGLLAAQKRLWPGEKIFDLQFPNLPAELERADGHGPDLPFPSMQLMAPPLDFWGAPGRCLDRLEPAGLVIVESELWPELLFQCRKRKIPVMIVSACLSERSAKRFLKVRSFIGPLLDSAAMIATISDEVRDRFLSLGVSPDRVKTVGSPKFDPLIRLARKRLEERLDGLGGEAASCVDAACALNASGGAGASRPLIVAGSTHPGEEELILDILEKMRLLGKGAEESGLNGAPRVRLILAPRHLGRLEEVIALIKGRGLKVKLWSEEAGKAGQEAGEPEKGAPGKGEAGKEEQGEDRLNQYELGKDMLVKNGLNKDALGESGIGKANQEKDNFGEACFGDQEDSVTVLDQVGILASLYRKASLCLVGGSFLRGCGHNPFEPAALGRPVIFGPHMSSFQNEAKVLVAAGGALQVPPEELPAAMEKLLSDKDAARATGEAGHKIVAGLEPVAPILAKLVVETIFPKGAFDSKSAGASV